MAKEKIVVPTPTKLKSGNWRVQLRIDGRSISITKPTKRAAVAEAMAIKEGIIQRRSTPLADLTLNAAIDRWMEDNKARLSPATVRGYKGYQKHGFQTIMHIRCSDLDSAKIARAVNAECKSYSAKTVVNRWRFLAEVIEWATGKTFDPELPQIVQKDAEFLDKADLDKLIKHIRGLPVEIPALLAISSLRRSELAALEWSDIDLKARWIHVRGAVVPDEDNKLVKKETNKNTTSRRDVPIIDPLYAALEAVECKEGRVVKMHPATVWRHIKAACAAAGVPEVGPHGLRHSFASLCHAIGLPPQAAMEIGGWSNRATMDRIYTHVSKRDKGAYENAFTQHFAAGDAENAHGNAHAD